MGEVSLRRPDGGPLPRRLSIAHEVLTGAPPPLRRQLVRLAPRLLGGRLPEMVSGYPDGRLFRAPAGDRMYSQVFIYGAYEPNESSVVAGLLQPGDFAIDVGANHGWFSLLMGSGVGRSGRVWAFEPVPPVLAALRANLELNPSLPIEVFPHALGDGDGRIVLHLFADLLHGHASASTLGRDDYVEYPTDVRTLDGLLEDEPTPPALVKLDVEGAELSVLRGSSKLIASPEAPIWMIEVNTETAAAFGYRPPELLAPFAEAGGYSVFRVGNAGLAHERRPDTAPHGTTWVVIPDSSAARAEGLLVR